MCMRVSECVCVCVCVCVVPCRHPLAFVGAWYSDGGWGGGGRELIASVVSSSVVPADFRMIMSASVTTCTAQSDLMQTHSSTSILEIGAAMVSWSFGKLTSL